MSNDHLQQKFNSQVDKLDFLGKFQATPEIRAHIEAIKLFYKNTFQQALQNSDTDLSIATLDQFQLFFNLFSDLKLKNITKEVALHLIEDITNKRLERINYNNNFYIIQLLLCMTIDILTITLFVPTAATSLGIIICVSIIISAAFMGAIVACQNFESTTPVYEENERYKGVILFFKPETNLVQSTSQPEPEMLLYGS